MIFGNKRIKACRKFHIITVMYSEVLLTEPHIRLEVYAGRGKFWYGIFYKKVGTESDKQGIHRYAVFVVPREIQIFQNLRPINKYIF